MTKNEFESISGMTTFDEQYRTIEEMYILAGNMDKHTFTKEYMNCKDNDLYRTFFQELKKCKAELQRANELLALAGKTIASAGYQYDNGKLCECGKRVLGEREYLLHVLNNFKNSIREEDLQLIIDNYIKYS